MNLLIQTYQYVRNDFFRMYLEMNLLIQTYQGVRNDLFRM